MTGDANAFDRFVEHFRAKIFHYSWLMCGQREDAEDVAQDTLLNVFESFDQLREPERVRPWVFRIARNACLMKRRKSVFAPSQELSLDDFLPAIDHQGGHAKLQIADWSGLPDRLILQSEMKQVLDQAISELPENYKSVILHAGYGGVVHAGDRPSPRSHGGCGQDAVASRAFGRPPKAG